MTVVDVEQTGGGVLLWDPRCHEGGGGQPSVVSGHHSDGATHLHVRVLSRARGAVDAE